MERQSLRPIIEGAHLILNSPLRERGLLAKGNLGQKALLSRINEIPLRDVWGLFSWYEKSEAFAGMVDIGGNRSDFAGKVFEDVAFIHTALGFPYQAVLSPLETKEVFNVLYPNAATIKFSFTESLNGVYLPDGLIVDIGSGIITNSLEYTTAGLNERFFEKIHAFEARKKYLKDLADANLTIVVPNGAIGDFDAVRGRNGIEVIELPFGRTIFRRAIDRFTQKSISKERKGELVAS